MPEYPVCDGFNDDAGNINRESNKGKEKRDAIQMGLFIQLLYFIGKPIRSMNRCGRKA